MKRERIAVIVTEISAPAISVAVQLLMAAVASSGTWLLCGGAIMLMITFGSALPFWFIYQSVRRGVIANHHAPVRSTRIVPMSLGVCSMVAGTALAWLLHIPVFAASAMTAVTAVTALLTLVTCFWKISAHTALLFSLMVTAYFAFGAIAAVAGLSIAVIGAWSRLELKAHTGTQVAAGGLLGTVIAVALFHLLS